jgi:hypothetical protein
MRSSETRPIKIPRPHQRSKITKLSKSHFILYMCTCNGASFSAFLMAFVRLWSLQGNARIIDWVLATTDTPSKYYHYALFVSSALLESLL